MTTLYNTFQNSLIQYAGYTGATGGTVVPPTSPAGGATILSATTTGNTGFIDLVFPTKWKTVEIFLQVIGGNDTGGNCAIQVGDSTGFYSSNYRMVGGGAISFFDTDLSFSTFGTSRGFLTLANQIPINSISAQAIQKLNASGIGGGYVQIANSSNLDRLRLRSTSGTGLFAPTTVMSVIYS